MTGKVSRGEGCGNKRPRLPERETQSMGWLTESTMQPRKHQLIEGVNGLGLPEMQAQLYKLEQAAAVKKAAGESLTKPRRGTGLPLGKANRGVEARDQLDRLLAPTEENRLRDSEAALQRKAALYDRLARGEGASDEEELYNVDFFGKATSGNVPDADALTASANLPGSRLGVGATQQSGDTAPPDGSREAARQQWERDSEQSYAAMSAEEERRQRRVDTVFELERETLEGRQRAAAEKEKRKQLEDQKRKQLKEAMLKQMAARLKGSKTVGTTTSRQ